MIVESMMPISISPQVVFILLHGRRCLIIKAASSSRYIHSEQISIQRKSDTRGIDMAKISYRVRPETAVLTRGFDPALSVGSARPPVYRSSTFVFPSPEAAERAFGMVLGKLNPVGEDRPDL